MSGEFFKLEFIFIKFIKAQIVKIDNEEIDARIRFPDPIKEDDSMITIPCF